MKIKIRETTQNSNKKIKDYSCTKVPQKTIVMRDEEEIVYNYTVKVKSI